VEPDTVILTLENPNLAQELTGAELELVAAEANLDDRRVQLRRQVLNQRSLLASVEAEARQAALDAEADAEIYAEGIIGRIALEDSQSAAAELRTRAQHEAERLQLAEQVAAAELTAEEARVARLRAVFDLKRELVSRLEVRAGIAGVLQEVSAEAGQQVAAGDNLARVAEPDRLKAELRIAEVQAKDIEVGQAARVDTRNGIVPGRVTRVEPAVRDGAVTVDVALTDELPRGARSELSVDGLVEIERLDDVLHVGRPAFGQEGDEVDLFRLSGGGDHAVRVRVLLGKASVNTVEIREGLAEGDTVILSDTSAWEGHGRIRLR
jgi:HlyD family secretion protein